VSVLLAKNKGLLKKEISDNGKTYICGKNDKKAKTAIKN
jgi:hypothetical protein